LELIGDNLAVKRIDLLPTVGGVITGQGRLKLPESPSNPNHKKQQTPAVFSFVGKNIPARVIARSYNITLPLDPGLVSGDTKLSGFLSDANSIRATGRAYFSFGGGIVRAENLSYYGGKWQTNLQSSGVKLASLPNIPCDNLSPEICSGGLNANLNLQGDIEQTTLDTITASGEAQLNTKVGTFLANQVQLNQGNWQTNLQAQQVKIAGIPNISCSGFMAQFCQGKLEGNFKIAGNLASLEPEKIVATGAAKVNTVAGSFYAHNLQLKEGKWQTNVEANQVKVARLIPDLPLRNPALNVQINLAGSLVNSTGQNNQTAVNNIVARGSGNLSSADGSVTANSISLQQGNFQAIVTAQNLHLAKFSPELKGTLKGRVNIAGNINNLNPRDVKLEGRLDFSRGLAFLEQPLTANLSWNGGRLAIDKATAKDSSISGFIDINAEGLTNLKNPLAAITNLRLNVGVKNLDIQSLPLQLPDNIAQVNYGGKLDFDGQVSGTPLSLVLDGEVGLNGFHLESLNFADMSGTVNLNPRDGLNLELLAEDGRKQQIQLSLDKQYSPLAFNFQHENMKATGRKEKQSLLVSTQNIDISLLKDFATKSLPETVSKEKIAGKMSGDFLFNFNNYSLVGKNVVIVNPTFGNLKGEILTARFQYIDGHLALSEGQLKNKQSIYQIDGSLSQTKAGPIVQGKVEVASAQIQDVLGTLQIFELEDFSRFANGFKPPHYDKVAALYQQDNRTENKAKDSPLFSVGSPEAPILNQLRRLTEIEQLKLINEQKRRDKSPLPELADLRGMFQGSMSVSGNLARGFSDIKVGFNFAGKDWQWGDHKANLVAAKGSLQEGILRLDPIQIQSDNSLLYLAGSLGEKTLSGELEIANLPVDKIQEFVDLPDLIGFGGLIDARIVLGGSKDNPVGRGEITVSDATINNTSVQSAQGSFSYSNSRLQFFASSVLANNSPPLTVSGSLPLPVSNFRAKSDDLNLKLSMKDSGLAMLNILTRDNIQWLDGKGNVDLNISGKINQKTFLPYQLRAEGMTTLENATIAAKFIPNAPLTEIKGKILFDFDDINVESLEGKFSGGKVKVGGTIPLIEDIPQANPLTVSLDNLAFNLKGIYQGGVKGDIQIKGTALYPNLGGQVELFNGKIFLSENVNGNGDSGIGANTDFDNLQLKLERDIFISAPPVLEFAAIGDLKVNGTLNKPLPQGTINLKRGQVNLFTSQLYLVSGHKNTAQFFAQNGLDPYLDVRLIGTATETAGKPIASDPNSSEISDRSSFSNANVGSLETIRILAEVNGFASQLANSIELKSSPPRNKTEIVALLGGDFANTLGRGDTTLGLANLAGQAFFNSFQNQIAEALGLSDFRIFPTQVIDSNERTESLALGMELGVNITSDLSVSAMKILTQDISPQVGIRYRINDNTVIRGSSDFDRDTRGVLEYQKRF
jgi:translocation and assembly module TamB